MLNNTERVENSNYFLGRAGERVAGARERLVSIHAWCLMGNHYHLLLSDADGSGVSMFLRKLNGGYSRYFNKKHNRSGALFQGKTKRVLVENNRQFLYILPYIHLNPLDFMKGGAGWRAQCLANPKDALRWVTNYRWSSYRNYTGETEYSEILEGSELFADRKAHVAELERFLKAMPDPSLSSSSLTLE
jgi:putative transposase